MKYGLKIALVQGNFTVGDIAGNLRRLRDALAEARAMDRARRPACFR